ncbi:unannotated protein [freshwater metagenome]|uniref:Unannotated protein n=1 Tax=freshwater metagenome TaxID=449393 RepID=A0A6J6LZG9_9ZZZZ|nr:NUDIX domain-containing protein [Actinomycetota bacterium]MSW10482.1 NUDIX domain-containing protein [Actinomycetota bacterium]MSX13614.1 NUDIX domain-containing protein [Actinomycetota bacterium]MSY16401.1 NUDIX domain-containing protein [Actinomycetota bacterium]MSY40871.1 NUDIX domain-containing protein [Actinomycetota bacterium]
MVSEDLVRAAGVVLLRGAPNHREVLIVHRPRRQDWSLPKGKVDPGEHVLAAAVRECMEESSYLPRLGAPLPTLTYNALGRPKQVRYWVATARSNKPFLPNDEVDEIQWLPVAQARHRLTYEHDADTVEAAAALEQTVPLIFLRHAQAVKRADFKGAHDASRPLTSKGKSQAKTLAPLLDAFAIESVHSSDATRCLETVKSLAKLLGTDVQQERDLSEAGFEQDERSARKRMKQLSLHSQATVVCSHRPVLPALMDVLTSALDVDVDPSVLDSKLSPGSFIVVHRVFHEDERPRVVAVERHNVAEG